MRILTFSSLYPNRVQPRHGIFVEERLKQLVGEGLVQARVVAPVPWFPLRNKIFGRWSEYSSVPGSENRSGIEVDHPRVPVIPKIGMSVAPILVSRSVKGTLRRIIERGYDFDIIDAHYFYPDGVAAVILGKWLRKPVVVSARGSDINLFPSYSVPRRWIRWAATKCDGIISVSQALRDRLFDLGAPMSKISVLRNGVDLELFRPLDRQVVRENLGISRMLLLSVGNLVELKGHHLAIEALAGAPDAELIIVGRGPEGPALRRLADSLGVGERVRFIDYLPREELVIYYNAADAVVLASSSEGMPNVVLEAIACGTPVIASEVGGVPEILSRPAVGILLAAREPDAIVRSIEDLRVQPRDRPTIRQHAEKFGWSKILRAQAELYSKIVAEHESRAAPGRIE